MNDILVSLSNKASPYRHRLSGFRYGRHVEGLICLSLAHYIQPKLISSCGRTAPPPHPLGFSLLAYVCLHVLLYMCARMQDVWHVCFCSACVYLCISGAKITTHMDSICGVCVCVFLRLSGMLCLRHATSFEGDCCVWNNSS